MVYVSAYVCDLILAVFASGQRKWKLANWRGREDNDKRQRRLTRRKAKVDGAVCGIPLSWIHSFVLFASDRSL